MRRVPKWMGLGSLSVLLLLSACGNAQTSPQQQNGAQTQSAGHAEHGQPDGVTVIPSIDRDKKLTTNRDNKTYSGMGTSLYSTIGSSGLHAGGPSTSLESRLNAAGIHGVQAMIINDMILVAPTSADTTSINQMDQMQAHLLGNYTGSSARGREWPDGTSGSMGTKSETNRSFARVRDQVERLFGSDAEVWTVTSREGVRVFEQVKKQMRENGGKQIRAEQLAALLREANRLP